MSSIKALWAKFRALPTGAQLIIAVVVLGIISTVLGAN